MSFHPIALLLSLIERKQILNDRLFAESMKPETKKNYVKNNHFTEKCCKFIYFAMLYISLPSFILPKVIMSYFIYYTTDSGPDAFGLPFEMWQVINNNYSFIHFDFFIGHVITKAICFPN